MTNQAIGLNNYATGENSRYPELWRGCVGAWAMCLGPTGTRLFDFSGRQNWGTLTNMDAATDWVVSGGRYALDFDGSNDFVNYGTNIPLGGATQVSFSAWVWRSVAGQMLVFNRYVNTTALGADRRADSFGTNTINANGTVSVYIQTANNVGYIGFNSTVAITSSEWNHIAATCLISGASSVGKTYINGKEVPNTTDFSGSLPLAFEPNVSSAPYTTCRYIGGNGNSFYNSGIVDDVRAYNRALTEPEIKLLASRRGIAYERRSRRRVNEQAAAAAALNAIYATRQTQLIGGGLL